MNARSPTSRSVPPPPYRQLPALGFRHVADRGIAARDDDDVLAVPELAGQAASSARARANWEKFIT